MRIFWISWWATEANGAFELHSPWWFSGYRDEPVEAQSACAAVRALDEDTAREAIFACHDTRPESLEFRFADQKPSDWSPYSGRFKKAAWMPEWPTE